MARERIEIIILRILKAIGILGFILMVIFPFYWMLISSFKSLEELLLNPSGLWPDFRKINLISYKDVLFQNDFVRYILNSTYVSGVTVALTLFFAVLGAYAAARFNFRGQKFMSSFILLIYMFPAIVLVIPLYVVFSKIGVRDSMNMLIFVYLAQTLPVSLYMLKSYFAALPQELEYAGLIDGCSRFGVIWKIVLPVAAPALAGVALYTFMIAWNEFLFVFLFIDTPEKFTLSRGIVQLSESVHLSKQLVMAASVLATIPILLVFFIFEKFLVKGLTEGALKG